MINYSINIIFLIIGSIMYTALGLIWYSKLVFGKVWMRLTKVEHIVEKPNPLMMLWPLFGGALISLAINFILVNMGITLYAEAIVFSVIIGLLYAIPINAANTVWEGKEYWLILLNSGFIVLYSMIMSIIFIIIMYG